MPNNPYLDQIPKFAPIEAGIKRRRVGDGEAIQVDDPTNWLEKTTRSSVGRLENDVVNGLPTLGYGALGMEDQRIDAANDYLKRDEEVRALGPRIQSFGDAAEAGGGVGDYLSAAGYMAVDSGIGMGMSLLGGGIGGGVARYGAKKAIRGAAADVLENTVEKQALKAEARKTAMGEAEKAALARGEAPDMVSAAVRGAAAQSDDQLRRETMKEAARLSGRTPIADGALNPVQAQARAAADAMRLSRDAMVKRGAGIGVTAAGLPQQLDSDFATLATDPNTSQDDMVALGLANTAASALDVLPLERLAGRFGGAAERAATHGFGERVARETLGQAATEGAQEVAQQATQNVGQAYVAGNLDPLIGRDAINEYIGSFIGGAVVGGAMGGAGEVGATGARMAGKAVGKTGEVLKTGYDYVNEKLGDYMAKLRKARLDQQFGTTDEDAEGGKRKYKAGERMDSEDTGDGSPEPKGTGGVFDFFLKTAGKVKTAATDAFDKAVNTLNRADAEKKMADDDAAATANFMAGGGDGRSFAPEDTLYTPDNLPAGFKFKTKAQRLGMSMLTPKAWQALEEGAKTDPGGTYAAAKQLAESFDRLASPTDALTEDDLHLHNMLVDDGFIDKKGLWDLKLLAGVNNDGVWTNDDSEGGPTKAVAPETVEGANGKFTLAEEMRAAVADAESARAKIADDGGDFMEQTDVQGEFGHIRGSEVDPNPLGRGPAGSDATQGEHITSLRRTIEETKARLESAKTTDAKDEHKAVLDETRKAHHEAVIALRQDILGGGNVVNGTFDETGKNAGKNEALRADPSRVELVRKGEWVGDHVTKEVPQFLSIDNLLRRQRARYPHKYYGVVDDAQVNKAALFDALGEVALAGIPLKLDTFTPGPVYEKAKGEGSEPKLLFDLTDADVEKMRDLFTGESVGEKAASAPKRRAAVEAANAQVEAAKQAHAEAVAALTAANKGGFKNRDEKAAALAPLREAIHEAAAAIKRAEEQVSMAKNRTLGPERAAEVVEKGAAAAKLVSDLNAAVEKRRALAASLVDGEVTQAQTEELKALADHIDDLRARIKDATPETTESVKKHRKKIRSGGHQRALNRNASDKDAVQDDFGSGVEGTKTEDERYKLGERGRPITGVEGTSTEEIVVGASGSTDVEQEVLDASLQERRDALAALARKLGVKPSSIKSIEAKPGTVAVAGKLAPATVTFLNDETENRKVPFILLGYSPDNMEKLKKRGAFTSKNRTEPKLKLHERPLADRDELVDTRDARDDAAGQLDDLLDGMLDTVGDKGKSRVIAAYVESQQEKLDGIADEESKQYIAIKLGIRDLKSALSRWSKMTPDERGGRYASVVDSLRKYGAPEQVKSALLGIAVGATKAKHKFKQKGLDMATTMPGEELKLNKSLLDEIIIAAEAASDGVENWISDALIESGRQALSGNEREAAKAKKKKVREASSIISSAMSNTAGSASSVVPRDVIRMLLRPDGVRRAGAYQSRDASAVSDEFVASIKKLLETDAGKNKIRERIANMRSETGLAQLWIALTRTGNPDADVLLDLVDERAVNVVLDMFLAGRGLRSYFGDLAAQGLTEEILLEQSIAVYANNGSLRRTLEDLLKTRGGTPAQMEVLRMFAKSKFIDSLGYEVKLLDDGSQNGGVSMTEKGFIKLQINPTDDVSKVKQGYHGLYTHELGHALTQFAERNDPELRRDVDLLLTHVINHAEAKGIDIAAVYGFSTTQEFIAEAFSNPEVQALLRTIPALNTKSFKSAWAEFKDFVQKAFANLLGKPVSPTALDEIITLGIKMGSLNPQTLTPNNATTPAQAQNAIHAATVSNMAVYGRDAKGRFVSKTEAEKRAETQGDLLGGSSTPPPSSGDGATPPPTPPPSEGSSGPGFEMRLESIAEFIDTVLGKDERAILDRAMRVPANRMRLQELASNFMGADLRSLLNDPEQGPSYTAAMAYVAWKHGELKIGPKADGIMAKIAEILKAVFNIASNSDMAHRIFSDMETGRINRMKNAGKTYSARAIEAKKRGWAQALANKLNEENTFTNALQSFWTSNLDRMMDSGIPAFRTLAVQLQRPQGTTGGDLGAIPNIRRDMFAKHRQMQNIMQGLNPRQRVKTVTIMQRRLGAGDALYDGASPEVKAAAAGLRKLFDQMYAEGQEAGFRYKARKNYFPVLMDMTREGSEEKLAKLYAQDHFRKALFDLYEVAEKERNDATHKRLVERSVAAATWDGQRTFEQAVIGSKSPADVRAASMNRQFSAFVYELGTPEDIKAFASMQTKDIDEVFARHFNPNIRAMEFRRRFGDPAFFDFKPDEDMDADDIAHGFRRAARGKLDDLLEKIKAQGGTERDVQFAENAVKAAFGLYGQDVSPTLNALSPAMAKKFSGKQTKAFIQGAQAYQNARLLPLSILSSLVDPMGVAVRTGGDFKLAWEGFKTGVKSLMNKDYAREMLQMLEEVGLGDDVLPAIANAPMFDKANGFAHKVNERVFKYNGMQAWVHSTRVMALNAGHRFLLKARDNVVNGKDPEGHYKRYLDELGLAPGDITEAEGKPNRVQINDNTARALSQFVDEAILRPNSQQSPLWYSDPFMGLVTQYKQFGYAIYDQISKRALNEFSYGNYRALLAALAYLPMALIAELIREFIQYAGGGNPNRKEWGIGEYTGLAAERTGLLSPQIMTLKDLNDDRQRGNMPGISQLGPTGGQALNITDALQGRRDAGKEVEAALPGSAAWKKWNDEAPAADAEAGLQRRAA